MLDFLHDRYSLAEQSKIFTCSLGSKAVQEIIEKMAAKLFEAYGADALSEIQTTNMQ
jgi:pantoate kinase